MTRLALPHSGKTTYNLPDQGTDTGQMAEMYEQNKRLDGVSPLPALMVHTDPDAVAIARQPVSMNIELTPDLGGTEDMAPYVFATVIKGSGWDAVTGSNPGWVFPINIFSGTGQDAGDGEGVEHIWNLAEVSLRSDAFIADVRGWVMEAAFFGASANAGTAGTIASGVANAPLRKDGNTGGTASIVYAFYVGGVDLADLGASEGSSIYIADGGQLYVTGHSVLGGGITIADVSPIFWGDLELETDGSHNLVANKQIHATGLVSSGAIAGTSLVNAGDFDHRFVGWITGSPEGVVFAKRGSWAMRTDGGAGTTLYVKESGDFDTGWVGK